VSIKWSANFTTKSLQYQNSIKKIFCTNIEMFKKYGLKGKYDIKFVMLSSYGCETNSHYNALNITNSITLNEIMKL
jgi:hypothetical protein